MTNGKLTLTDKGWEMTETPPHVAIKLKAIFGHIPKYQGSPFHFQHTPESCADLLWFTDRYPMEISDTHLAALKRAKAKNDKTKADIERILIPDYKPVIHQFKDGKAERHYQAVAREVYLKVRRMICGDDLGLGKTTVALGSFMEPKTLPALVVVQTHLPVQWRDRIYEFTTLNVHRIEGTKPYSLPPADVYIIKYSCLAGWVNFFETGYFKSVVFDEIQELRKDGSQKYESAKVLCAHTKYVLGLTATLIYNYGDEAFNIFDVIKPGCLGTRGEFLREWSDGNGRVIKDPAALGSYLRSQHLFVRRTRAEVKMELPPVNKIIYEVEMDDDSVHNINKLAKQLAMRVVSGTFIERGEAAREFDMMMRMNTGIGKARAVANYVKILLENKEPVILFGWHREVYRIWLEELAEYKPAMYTGSESGVQKQRAKEDFMSGKTDLMIMSLRSGSGIDGLQERCGIEVFGELDWSPGVHNQDVGRIDRPGRRETVSAIYIVCNEGSDPTMMEVLGLKSSQAAYIADPDFKVTQQFSDDSRIKQMATNYLKKHGADVENLKPSVENSIVV